MVRKGPGVRQSWSAEKQADISRPLRRNYQLENGEIALECQRRPAVSCPRGRAMTKTVMRELLILAIGCFLILVLAAGLIIHFVP
jgi:hypothetical protein